jgi:putative nucleotidyltransferase with HDIG domain
MNQTFHKNTLRADFRHVIYALADALDLVGVDDQGHGKRVGIMAVECARQLGYDVVASSFLFDLGLLHDIGVSSTVIHGHLVSEFDWSGSQVHCEVGYRLLRDFAPLARLAAPIKYHHTRWDALLAQDIPQEIAQPANLIYLVDRVDALSAAYAADGGALMHSQAIRDHISANAGTYFCPELVSGFLAASDSEAFWLNLEPRGIQAFLAEMLEHGHPYGASVNELKQLATIFSRIVDAKSPFTAEHSLGVAKLSRFFAERLGVSTENCDKLEIAGLLHDIGKLRVPDNILEKPAKLDESERKIMNTHSFETYQILRLIPGFEEIAPWAAYHHEEPDGTGYPFRLSGEALSLEARILRVADIFQAMVQDRPYRSGLSADGVRQFMEELVGKGRIDGEIFAVAANDMATAMAAALPGKA